MRDRVYFETGRAEISPADSSWVSRAAEWIKRFRGIEIDIVGYADERGNPAANKRLALKRARALYTAFLVHGVPAEQLADVMANGTGRPLVEGHTEEAWAKNRAVVARVRHVDLSCKLRDAPERTRKLTYSINDLPPDVYIDFIGRLSAHTFPGVPAITSVPVESFDRTGRGGTGLPPRKFSAAASSDDRLVIWYDHGGPRLHFHAVAYALTEQGPRFIANVLSRDICNTTDVLLRAKTQGLRQAAEW